MWKLLRGTWSKALGKWKPEVLGRKPAIRGIWPCSDRLAEPADPEARPGRWARARGQEPGQKRVDPASNNGHGDVRERVRRDGPQHAPERDRQSGEDRLGEQPPPLDGASGPVVGPHP